MSAILKKSIRLNDRREDAKRALPGFRSRRGEKLVEGLSKAQLVQKYESKVRLIAGRLASNLPASVDVEDLVSVGFIGLMDAADKFNPSHGVKFSTYAEFRIRGAILDELRSQDWVPHCARGKARSIETAYHKLERESGRRPTEAEVGKEMGLSRDRLQKLKNRVGSLTMVSLEDQEEPVVESSEATNPFISALKRDQQSFIEHLLMSLSDEEKLVLRCYYLRGLNLKEISQIMALTESRISQIHTKAIIRLKERLKADVSCPRTMFTLLLETA